MLGFLLSLSFHEAAHAYMAYRLGDDTAKHEGRLTLNPLAHLDLFGTLALLLIGFGWGKPVPYNPNRLRSKFDEIKVALAGPLTNVILAFLLAIPFRYAVLRDLPITSSPWIYVLSDLSTLNVILASFNILPIPPLDGSKILMIWMDTIQKVKFLFYGQWILIALVFFQIVSNINILWRIMQPLVYVLSILTKGTAISPNFL